ncbi:MAG: hypothetical protein MZV49_14095 [Rhodopseudomonas palustris]|nr:hypothetical protein [Rhodopseudomonas palustris]
MMAAQKSSVDGYPQPLGDFLDLVHRQDARGHPELVRGQEGGGDAEGVGPGLGHGEFGTEESVVGVLVLLRVGSPVGIEDVRSGFGLDPPEAEIPGQESLEEDQGPPAVGQGVVHLQGDPASPDPHPEGELAALAHVEVLDRMALVRNRRGNLFQGLEIIPEEAPVQVDHVVREPGGDACQGRGEGREVDGFRQRRGQAEQVGGHPVGHDRKDHRGVVQDVPGTELVGACGVGVLLVQSLGFHGPS